MLSFFTSVHDHLTLGVLGVPPPPLQNNISNDTIDNIDNFEYFNKETTSTLGSSQQQQQQQHHHISTFSPNIISDAKIRNEFTFGFDVLHFIEKEMKNSSSPVYENGVWNNMLGMNSSSLLRPLPTDFSQIILSSKRNFNNFLPIREIQTSILRDDYNVFSIENGKYKNRFTSEIRTMSLHLNPFKEGEMLLKLLDESVLLLSEMKVISEFLSEDEVFSWGPSMNCILSISRMNGSIHLRDRRSLSKGESALQCSRGWSSHKQITSLPESSLFITNDVNTISMTDLRLPSKSLWNVDTSFLGWMNCSISKVIPYNSVYQFLLGNNGDYLLIINNSITNYRPFECRSLLHSIKFISPCLGCYINADHNVSFSLENGIYNFNGIDELLSLREIGDEDRNLNFFSEKSTFKVEKFKTISLCNGLILDDDGGGSDDDGDSDDDDIVAFDNDDGGDGDALECITRNILSTASKCLKERW